MIVSGSVILIILLGSALRPRPCQRGLSCRRDARGVPVDPNTTDPDERRLMNIVEEMSIASGVSVPAYISWTMRRD